MNRRAFFDDLIAISDMMKRLASMVGKMLPGLPTLAAWAMAICPVLSAQSVSENRVMQAASPPATVRVISRLVVLDVVVLDKGKKPVHGLQASDFHVLEDGKKQTVGSFEEHPVAVSAGQADSGMAHEAAQGIFTNAAPTPFAGSSDSVSLDVFLIDALNTTVSDREYARSQLIEFLKSPGSGNQAAVFALHNDRLLLVQGFTADKERLKAAVRSSRVAPVSSLLTDTTGMGGDGPQGFQPLAAQALQLQLRARYTLDALNRLARYLAELPGRKRLFWLSGSFPLSVTADVRLEDSMSHDLDADQKLRATMNLFAQSRVAVYPISAHGLASPFGNDASNSDKKYVRRPDLLTADMTAASENQGADQLTMEQMARATGGRAFYNSNALGQAIAHAIDSSATFYTLSYRPDGVAADDGVYRQISVECARREYLLEYRHGYFAVQPGTGVGVRSATKAEDRMVEKAALPADFRAAMQREAPDELGVIFKARVLPFGPTSEPQAAPSNKTGPKAKGPWRRYQIDVAADPRAFRMLAAKDGSYQATIGLAVVVYAEDGNDGGEIVNTLDETVTHSFTRAQLEEASRTGLAVFTQISVPKRGNYSLRIGIRDAAGGSIGALELPVAAVKDLPALPSASR
jgi:VWFA-related protein